MLRSTVPYLNITFFLNLTYVNFDILASKIKNEKYVSRYFTVVKEMGINIIHKYNTAEKLHLLLGAGSAKERKRESEGIEDMKVTKENIRRLVTLISLELIQSSVIVFLGIHSHDYESTGMLRHVTRYV